MLDRVLDAWFSYSRRRVRNDAQFPRRWPPIKGETCQRDVPARRFWQRPDKIKQRPFRLAGTASRTSSESQHGYGPVVGSVRSKTAHPHPLDNRSLPPGGKAHPLSPSEWIPSLTRAIRRPSNPMASDTLHRFHHAWHDYPMW